MFKLKLFLYSDL